MKTAHQNDIKWPSKWRYLTTLVIFKMTTLMTLFASITIPNDSINDNFNDIVLQCSHIKWHQMITSMIFWIELEKWSFNINCSSKCSSCNQLAVIVINHDCLLSASAFWWAFFNGLSSSCKFVSNSILHPQITNRSNLRMTYGSMKSI